MGTCIMGVGAMIAALGAYLLWGNLTAVYRTAPFVGYLTLVLGVGVVSFGRRKQLESRAARQPLPPPPARRGAPHAP